MRIYGKQRGFVVDNNDPLQLRRLRVRVPAYFGGEVLEWAWPCEVYGGLGQTAAVLVPEVGAGVWVEFEDGDPSRPIWAGVWSGRPRGVTEIPDQAKENYPRKKVLRTKSGHVIEIDDTPDKEVVRVTTSKGRILELADVKGAEKIRLETPKALKVLLDDRDGQEKIAITDGVNSLEWDKQAGKITASPGTLVVLAGESYKALLGELVREWCNSHTHAADGAPPSSPMPESVLSAKVRLA